MHFTISKTYQETETNSLESKSAGFLCDIHPLVSEYWTISQENEEKNGGISNIVLERAILKIQWIELVSHREVFSKK